MKEINITKHALMRYASRVHKANIISDRTWDIWKKANEDKIEVLEASLKEEFKEARYINTAAYEGNKKAEFYINEQLLLYLVVLFLKHDTYVSGTLTQLFLHIIYLMHYYLYSYLFYFLYQR